MTTTQQGVLTLIRSAITGEKLALPEGFSLEEADELICRQSLLPLAYQGAYNCGIPSQDPIMQRYYGKYMSILLRSENQMRTITRIFRAFDENGIDYLPVKGCVLKNFYPQPEMRMMVDADILIRQEQYDRIRPIMEALDFKEGETSACDVHWHHKTILIELHRKLFSEKHKDLRRYFADGWSRAVCTGGHRYDMPDEDGFSYVFTHMAKHFRYAGIGVRQILDLWVYRRAKPDMDEGKIEQIMDRIHMLDFYRNIRRLLTVWFEGAETDPVTDLITNYVFSGGNFGSMEVQLESEVLAGAKTEGSMKNTRGRMLRNVIFLPMDKMRQSYNILYKYPFLYPFCWVARCFDILLHRRKNIRRKMAVVRGASDEKIVARQKLLNDMGVDFYYDDE